MNRRFDLLIKLDGHICQRIVAYNLKLKRHEINLLLGESAGFSTFNIACPCIFFAVSMCQFLFIWGGEQQYPEKIPYKRGFDRLKRSINCMACSHAKPLRAFCELTK